MDQSAEYASGLRDVLIRKINKAEQSLYELKLDYCRFVYGLSHRSQVIYDGVVYQVRAVDLELMERTQNGEWTKPGVKAVRYQAGISPRPEGALSDEDLIDLGQHWELYQS